MDFLESEETEAKLEKSTTNNNGKTTKKQNQSQQLALQKTTSGDTKNSKKWTLGEGLTSHQSRRVKVPTTKVVEDKTTLESLLYKITKQRFLYILVVIA